MLLRFLDRPSARLAGMALVTTLLMGQSLSSWSRPLAQVARKAQTIPEIELLAEVTRLPSQGVEQRKAGRYNEAERPS